MEEPHSLKSNEMAQCSFQPQQPLVCDTFKNCEGLSRVAFMDGNGVVMLGKVVTCERKDDSAAAGKKVDGSGDELQYEYGHGHNIEQKVMPTLLNVECKPMVPVLTTELLQTG